MDPLSPLYTNSANFQIKLWQSSTFQYKLFTLVLICVKNIGGNRIDKADL